MANNLYDVTAPKVPQELIPDGRSKLRSVPRAITLGEVRAGQVTMFDMVKEAFETLREALAYADYNTAVKAAQIILDRSGFGPKTTIDVNSTHLDLSSLTREELAIRASKIAGMLQASREPINITPLPDITVKPGDGQCPSKVKLKHAPHSQEH